jgi:hypothetical protein
MKEMKVAVEKVADLSISDQITLLIEIVWDYFGLVIFCIIDFLACMSRGPWTFKYSVISLNIVEGAQWFMGSAIARFNSPANITDFDMNSPLADKWNEYMASFFQEAIKRLEKKIPSDKICIFDPRKQPEGQLKTDHITWGGFPNGLRARYSRPKQKAFQLAEKLATFGNEDDLGGQYDAYYADPQGKRIFSLNYRQQDEYLEWAVHRDEMTGKIKEIVFTCEGPEYWAMLSKHDVQLLLELYKINVSPEVTKSDLFFSDDVYIKNRNGDYSIDYHSGDYNPYNKWNLSYAMHLTHPANSLYAEVVLAAEATVLRKNGGGDPITDPHALICCASYGEPNRNSDPTIGFRANSLVRDSHWVSLRNPVGLYIAGIDPSQFTKPDGSIINDFGGRYWNILRASEDHSMILRATVKVPEGEMFNGKPLLLGDLLVNGDPLEYGGQVADTITVGLFAIAVTGGPNASPISCGSKCCANPHYPNTDKIIPVSDNCPEVQHELFVRNISTPVTHSTRSTLPEA